MANGEELPVSSSAHQDDDEENVVEVVNKKEHQEPTKVFSSSEPGNDEAEPSLNTSSTGEAGGGLKALLGRFEQAAKEAEEKKLAFDNPRSLWKMRQEGGGEFMASPTVDPFTPSAATVESPANEPPQQKDQTELENEIVTDTTAKNDSPANQEEQPSSKQPSVAAEAEEDEAEAVDNDRLTSNANPLPSELLQDTGIMADNNQTMLLEASPAVTNNNGTNTIVALTNVGVTANDKAFVNSTDHPASENREISLKKALVSSTTTTNNNNNNNLKTSIEEKESNSNIVPSDEKDATSNVDSNATHDAELDAFYESVKESKKARKTFVPPTYIVPKRKYSKHDAFGRVCKNTAAASASGSLTSGEGYSQIQEPNGHRIEEDYTKPPPQFAVARPSRKLQHKRKQYNNKQHVVVTNNTDTPTETTNQPPEQMLPPENEFSPETSLTSSEPKGRRLEDTYGPNTDTQKRQRNPQTIVQERLQSALDCQGLALRDEILYPKPRVPVDVPGVKLPNKFPGQVETQEKMEILKQQVAVVKKIVKLRAIKQETEELKASLRERRKQQQQQQQQQQSSSDTMVSGKQNEKEQILFEKKNRELAQQHQMLLEKFEHDVRVTQSMHEEMVKLVQAATNGNTVTTMLSPTDAPKSLVLVPSKKQLLQQLEYDSLRQKIEYEKLMEQFGKMLAQQDCMMQLKTTPVIGNVEPLSGNNPQEPQSLPDEVARLLSKPNALAESRFTMNSDESIPFDEEHQQHFPPDDISKFQPLSTFQNTVLPRVEPNVKSPSTTRRTPQPTPPVRVTMSKAPLPAHGRRTIDAILPLFKVYPTTTSRKPTILEETIPFDEDAS